MTPVQNNLLSQFHRLGIRYLVVGGQAMRALGIDRRTRDLDVWIARDLANVEALTGFMQHIQNVPPLERLQQANFMFTVGDPTHPEVDILTSVAGDPPFDVAFARADHLMLDGRRILVVTITDLLAIKEASAERMGEDATDSTLSEAEQVQAAETGARERKDIELLQALLASRR